MVKANQTYVEMATTGQRDAARGQLVDVVVVNPQCVEPATVVPFLFDHSAVVVVCPAVAGATSGVAAYEKAWANAGAFSCRRVTLVRAGTSVIGLLNAISESGTPCLVAGPDNVVAHFLQTHAVSLVEAKLAPAAGAGAGDRARADRPCASAGQNAGAVPWAVPPVIPAATTQGHSAL